MRFLVDESTGDEVAHWLRQIGHDVYSVYESSRGLPDEEVIEKANLEDRILITNDKDFGEKVYRDGYGHRGVVFLRLSDERTSSKIATLDRLLNNHATELATNFVVVTEKRVRFGRTS